MLLAIWAHLDTNRPFQTNINFFAPKSSAKPHFVRISVCNYWVEPSNQYLIRVVGSFVSPWMLLGWSPNRFAFFTKHWNQPVPWVGPWSHLKDAFLLDKMRQQGVKKSLLMRGHIHRPLPHPAHFWHNNAQGDHDRRRWSPGSQTAAGRGGLCPSGRPLSCRLQAPRGSCPWKGRLAGPSIWEIDCNQLGNWEIWGALDPWGRPAVAVLDIMRGWLGAPIWRRGDNQEPAWKVFVGSGGLLFLVKGNHQFRFPLICQRPQKVHFSGRLRNIAFGRKNSKRLAIG